MFRSTYYSKKPLKIVLVLLSLKGLTQAYLMKASMAHNKYLASQFLEDNDPLFSYVSCPNIIFGP